MRRKAASMLGLLGFAVVAVLGAVVSADFTVTLSRAILAAVAMTAVGYAAGTIAERAISEAVDAKAPLRQQPTVETLQKAAGATEEVDR